MSSGTSLIELKAYGAKRDQLLARIVQALENDSRVVAAWLTGSFAAGTADEWSDVDLCVAIQDDHFGIFVEQRREIYNGVGEAVGQQSFDPHRNSENPGSQFDLLIYRGGLHVDWTLMPLRLAHRSCWAN